MKIQTTIAPRRDGTVKVAAPSGALLFINGGDGRLVCDVTSDADASFLLKVDGFMPASEADIAKAEELIGLAGDDDILDGDQGINITAAPIDAMTPVKSGKKKGA